MNGAGAGRRMISAVPFDHAAFAVHGPWPRPVTQRVIGPSLVSPFRRHVEISVDTKELFAAAAIGRVGMEDLAAVVLVENAITGEIFDPGRPFRRSSEIVESAAGSNLLGREGDVEVVVEIAAVRRNPGEAPPHTFADGFDLFDWSTRHGRVGHVVVSQMFEQTLDMVDLE